MSNTNMRPNPLHTRDVDRRTDEHTNLRLLRWVIFRVGSRSFSDWKRYKIQPKCIRVSAATQPSGRSAMKELCLHTTPYVLYIYIYRVGKCFST